MAKHLQEKVNGVKIQRRHNYQYLGCMSVNCVMTNNARFITYAIYAEYYFWFDILKGFQTYFAMLSYIRYDFSCT